MQDRKAGVVLIIVMSFLTVLLLLVATVHVIMTLNAQQTGYTIAAAQAFEQANAGADYVFERVRREELSGVVTLKTTNVAINYTPPSGYTFDAVTNLTRLSNARAYRYRVVGRHAGARAQVDVVLARASTLFLGVFGNTDVSVWPGVNISSYRSSVTTVPTSSTGEASVGSNVSMGGDNNTVDGTIYLGEAANGTPASYAHEFTTSATVIRTTRIDPDPFGAASGLLSNQFAFVSVTNANSTAIGGTLSAGKLTISGNVTLGAGNYYVSNINLRNGDTLTIDAAAGPVNIYLLGDVATQANAAIAVSPAVPDSLRIYARGASTIDFKPKTDFIGFIYAPYGSVYMAPNNQFRGALYADSITLKPGSDIYVDNDFIDSFDMDQPLTRLSWKHVIE